MDSKTLEEDDNELILCYSEERTGGEICLKRVGTMDKELK